MTRSRNEGMQDVWFPNTELVPSHTMLTPSGVFQASDSALLYLLPPLHLESISFHPSLSAQNISDYTLTVKQYLSNNSCPLAFEARVQCITLAFRDEPCQMFKIIIQFLSLSAALH